MRRARGAAGAGPAPPLRFGPYRAPKCRKGDWIHDEVLGLIEVMGWTSAPLSWPRRRQKGPPCPVLTDALARAIHRESERAVAAAWGVSCDWVRRQRHVLGVDENNEGTRLLKSENYAALPAKARAKLTAALGTPQAKAAFQDAMQARAGKPAHPNTQAALARGRQQPRSAEWNRRANEWMLAGKAKASRKRTSRDT